MEVAFPLLNESHVVIDLRDLSELERQPILYNHLKLGKHPAVFRSTIAPHLEYVAAHLRFIPETARRIADHKRSLSVFKGRLPHHLFQGLRDIHCTLPPACSLSHQRGSFTSPARPALLGRARRLLA